jgi:hypothetical protein
MSDEVKAVRRRTNALFLWSVSVFFCFCLLVGQVYAYDDPFIVKFLDFSISIMHGQKELVKWENEIQVVVNFDDQAPRSLFKQILALFGEYRDLTGNKVSFFTDRNVDGNVLVLFSDNFNLAANKYRPELLHYFGDEASLNDFINRLDVSSRCVVQVAFEKYGSRIRSAVLLVNTNLAKKNQDEENAAALCVARSVAYILGSLNPRGTNRFESVINPQSKLTDFSEDDKKFLKIMYDRDFPSGIPEQTVIQYMRSMNDSDGYGKFQ